MRWEGGRQTPLIAVQKQDLPVLGPAPKWRPSPYVHNYHSLLNVLLHPLPVPCPQLNPKPGLDFFKRIKRSRAQKGLQMSWSS